MKWLAKLVVELVKAAIASFASRLRRDREMKEAGRTEVIENAHKEADERRDAAQKFDAEWDALSPDERERVRDAKDIYRD